MKKIFFLFSTLFLTFTLFAESPDDYKLSINYCKEVINLITGEVDVSKSSTNENVVAYIKSYVNKSCRIAEIYSILGDEENAIKTYKDAEEKLGKDNPNAAKVYVEHLNSLYSSYEADQQDPEKCRELLEKVGICFMFAQKYHTSMKYVGSIRKELGIRTVFNILGPLTNPANPSCMVLGVYDEYLLQPLAQVMAQLGVRRGMVVYGVDKLDEISTSCATKICEFRDGWYKTYEITPEQFGFERCEREDLKGGTPEENAQITRKILSGEKGPKRDTVVLNAAACLYVSGKADDMNHGVKMAEELIDNGSAQKILESYIRISNE